MSAGDLCEHWGPVKVARFKRAHAEGLADWQLAERFGVTPMAVYKMRLKLRLKTQQDHWAGL